MGALLRERLGDEVVDRLVEPLLGGVYAGRADELSLAATMPALADAPAATPARCSLPRRPRGTPGSAAAATPTARCSRPCGTGSARCRTRWSPPPAREVRLRTPAHALRRTARGFELSVGPVAAPELLTADAVLVAAPAAKAARLLGEVAPGAVEPLQGIPYASMAVVAMAFPAQDVDAGSGLLVPPVAGRLVKGVTVSSSKWPHLAGGGRRPRALLGRPLPR